MSTHDVLNIMQPAMVMAVMMRMVMAMFVLVAVFMLVAMFMLVAVFMRVAVFVRMVMRMLVMIVMTFFLLAMYHHSHMRSGDPAFYRRFRFENNARNPQLIEFLYQFIGIGQQFKQCSRQHISCRTHTAIKI